MPRDILREYGPEAHKPQAPRAQSGGVTRARDVHNYQPPKGPTNINDPESPGLHGDNHGHAHCPTGSRGGESGRPGLGATNIHKGGSQRG